MISDQAVQAAAQNLYASDGLNLWASEDESVRRHYERKARAALDAANTHLLGPVLELSDDLAASALCGDSYQEGRGSGFRIAGVRIRQVLGLKSDS